MTFDDLSQIELVAGDLRDEYAVNKAVEGCELVFYLRVSISIPYSSFHPAEVVSTNFIGTLNVLMACCEHGATRLVRTSTREAYGTTRQVPIDENNLLHGQSPYSAERSDGADNLVESFADSYEFSTVIVRLFKKFSSRQSARTIIPTITTRVLVKDEIKLGSLSTTRDFTFIADTVNGFLYAAEAEVVGDQVFNLGTG